MPAYNICNLTMLQRRIILLGWARQQSKGGSVFNIHIQMCRPECVHSRQQLAIYNQLSWLLLASCASHAPLFHHQHTRTNSSRGGDSSIAFNALSHVSTCPFKLFNIFFSFVMLFAFISFIPFLIRALNSLAHPVARTHMRPFSSASIRRQSEYFRAQST